MIVLNLRNLNLRSVCKKKEISLLSALSMSIEHELVIVESNLVDKYFYKYLFDSETTTTWKNEMWTPPPFSAEYKRNPV